MSVSDRVDDARFLAGHDRHEAALMNVLLAVAAASAAAYPESGKAQSKAQWSAPGVGWDRWRFSEYLRPRLAHLVAGDPAAAYSVASIEFKGVHLDIVEVLYKHFRCALVHEGKLPANVVWEPTQPGRGLVMGCGSTLTLGGDWFQLLALAALDRMPAPRKTAKTRAMKPNDPKEWSRFLEQELRDGRRMMPGSVYTLADVLQALDVTSPHAASDGEIQDAFQRLILAGDVTPNQLRSMRVMDQCIDDAGRLTPIALGIVRELLQLVEFPGR